VNDFESKTEKQNRQSNYRGRRKNLQGRELYLLDIIYIPISGKLKGDSVQGPNI